MEVLEHAGTAAERGPIIYEAHVPTTRVGTQTTQPPEYTPVKIEHVQRTVGAFKSKPGFTEAKVRATRASNPSGDGKKRVKSHGWVWRIQAWPPQIQENRRPSGLL